MRWLSNLRAFWGCNTHVNDVDNEEAVDQAKEILDRARQAVDEARARRTETSKVATTLVTLNGLNHYGESIFLAMMPRKKY